MKSVLYCDQRVMLIGWEELLLLIKHTAHPPRSFLSYFYHLHHNIEILSNKCPPLNIAACGLMGTSMLLKLNELISVHFNNFIEATLLWWTVDTFSKFLNSKQFSLAGADESFQFQNNEDLDKSWDKMKIKYQLNHFIQSAAEYRTPLEVWMLVCVFLDWRTTEGLLTLDFRLWSIKFTSLQVAALRS